MRKIMNSFPLIRAFNLNLDFVALGPRIREDDGGFLFRTVVRQRGDDDGDVFMRTH
jgi:hypothetical protein